MINRKFTMSALSIVLSMAIMGGTTFAFFTDQAQSTNNTFSTGTADLQVGLDTGNENTVAFANAIDAPDYSGVFPGFSSNTDFWLKNVSSSTVNLSTVADLSNLVENAGTDLKNNLLISWNCDTDDNGSLGDNT